MKQVIHWLTGKRGDMVEGALTLPVMALLALALVNLALAGFAAATAQNAAAYGARTAAVTQDNPAARGLDAASQVVTHGVGDYAVNIAADNRPGGQVRVEVTWQVPNVFGGLLAFFGGSSDDVISGQAVAVQRKEGW